MVVLLLKVELLSDAHTIDTCELYSGKFSALGHTLATHDVSSFADDTYCHLERNKLQNVRILIISILTLADVAQNHASHTQIEGTQAWELSIAYMTALINYSNVTARRALDDMIHIRLLGEENQTWTEKAVITRVWIDSSDSISENILEQLQDLFDTVLQNSKAPLSAPATHAAQTVGLQLLLS